MTQTTDNNNTQEDRIWYFSFGSNMDKHVLQKRRGIRPVESVACRVPGYRITFDLRGLAYLEPAFANIEKVNIENGKEENSDDHKIVDPSCDAGNDDGSGKKKLNHLSELHGVAHLITPEEYKQIRYSEGGSGHDGHGYSDVDVRCIDYGGREFVAKALIAHEERQTKHRYLPSLRYLNLLRRGAREHHLDQKWIDYLDGLEAYEQSRSSKIATVVLLPLTLFIFVPFLVAVFATKIFKKQTPLFAVQYFFYAQLFLWLLHDYVLIHIFGSGRCNAYRTIEKKIKKEE